MMQQKQEEHQYVIIGAGISGLQAGIILAESNKDFIVIEASEKIGGRIGTELLCDILKKQISNEENYPQWLTNNPKVLNTPIEYGATWISQQHQFLLKILKESRIKVFPQYYDGLAIYGRQPGKYEEVRSVEQHYKEYSSQITRLIDKIEKLKNSYKEIKESRTLNRKSSEEQNNFIDTYDTISVRDYILGQMQNEHLARELINQFQTLQCISGDKISMMQLIDDDSSLELIRFYSGKTENTIDGLRVQNGMITIPQYMYQKMLREAKKNKPGLKDSDLLILNNSVVKIQNTGNNIKIFVEGSKVVYVCKYIFISVPIAVISNIQIIGISQSKKIIFENQESGDATRQYLIFSEAFWRYKYNGYGSFNHTFPFNEMVELSPANLACGVLAFVFVADKYQKWVKENPDPVKRLEFLKGVVADIFLKGDRNSSHLQNCISYTRSFSNNPYIKAGYQATTKREVWKRIKDKGQDYNQSYDRDENNIVYIGSQFADQFSTYMEGAIRQARQKVYKILQMSDPWRN